MKTRQAHAQGGRRSLGRHAVHLAFALALVPALAALFSTTSGCTDMACLEWTSDKGTCPARDDALKHFGGQSCVADIQAVDSEPSFDGTACCYEVTKRPSGDRSCGVVGAGPTVGAGPKPAPCGGCAEFQSGAAPELCEASVSIFNTLAECLCKGPCAVACDDGSCAASFDTPECQTCVKDPENGCGDEFAACSNDI